MINDSPRRFVAGAVCPKCGEIDKLVLYRQQEVNVQECVRCGFSEQMRFESEIAPLETRVTREPEHPLRFVDIAVSTK